MDRNFSNFGIRKKIIIINKIYQQQETEVIQHQENIKFKNKEKMIPERRYIENGVPVVSPVASTSHVAVALTPGHNYIKKS